jgi:hypothetical protein
MLEIASDITIRLDEMVEEYLKIRQVKSDKEHIIVEVNGQKTRIKVNELSEALSKLQDLSNL